MLCAVVVLNLAITYNNCFYIGDHRETESQRPEGPDDLPTAHGTSRRKKNPIKDTA